MNAHTLAATYLRKRSSVASPRANAIQIQNSAPRSATKEIAESEPWPSMATVSLLGTLAGCPNATRYEAARLSIWMGRDAWPHKLAHKPWGASTMNGPNTTAITATATAREQTSSADPRRRSVHTAATGSSATG
jgi:hypothetical protein